MNNLAVHFGMGTRAVPQGPPVGKKSVGRVSAVVLAVDLRTLGASWSVVAKGPGADHVLGWVERAGKARMSRDLAHDFRTAAQDLDWSMQHPKRKLHKYTQTEAVSDKVSNYGWDQSKAQGIRSEI